MTTSIKTKPIESDRQTNIDKFNKAFKIQQIKVWEKLPCKYIPKLLQYLLNYSLFDNDYRVATLSVFHLIVTGIIMPSMKSIGQL